ncbi:MAG: hypothetical protein V5A84_01690, partial [Planctomycetota bacterium]
MTERTGETLKMAISLLLGCVALFSATAAAADESPPEKFDLLTPKDGAAVANKVDPMAGPALQWEASADPQSGIDHYEVWVDGKKVEEVPNGMYTAYPQDYGQHTWHVVAVNGAGLKRKSEKFTFTARTRAVCRDDRPERRFLNGPVYPSIQEAVDGAKSGDTILVYPGIYRETVTVDVPGLTIKAAQWSEQTRPDEPEIINAHKNDTALRIEADGVTVHGLSLENFTGAGLVIEGSDVTVLRNQLLGCKIGRGVLV